MNHRVGSIVFGIVVGLGVALWSLQWVADPDRQGAREQEEAVVLATRDVVAGRLQLETPEFVDPLAPRRAVGKVYIYPLGDGWQVSGYYRREAGDPWHPYLAELSAEMQLVALKVGDDAAPLRAIAADDPVIEIVE